MVFSVYRLVSSFEGLLGSLKMFGGGCSESSAVRSSVVVGVR